MKKARLFLMACLLAGSLSTFTACGTNNDKNGTEINT